MPSVFRVAAAAMLVAACAPARASAPLPIAVVTAAAYTFLPGDVDRPELTLEVARGGSLTFANLDPLGAHNIVADDRTPEGAPLFSSPTVAMGENAPVAGVEDLAPGRYAFRCEVHNPTMQGTLEVV